MKSCFALFALIIFFGACSQSITKQLYGSWQIKEMLLPEGVTDYQRQVAKDLESNSLITYYQDGTYAAQLSSMKDTGTWRMDTAKTMVMISTSGYESRVKVKEENGQFRLENITGDVHHIMVIERKPVQ